MSELLDSLRQQLGNSVIENCRTKESNCTIGFDTFSKHFEGVDKIAIDVDAVVGQGKVIAEKEKCDFLIIIEQDNLLLVIPVEIKVGGKVKPSHVIAQIQEGLKIFQQLVQGRRKKIIFIPCLLTERIRERDRDELMQRWVLFRGKRQRMRYMPCGNRFWEKIEKYFKSYK